MSLIKSEYYQQIKEIAINDGNLKNYIIACLNNKAKQLLNNGNTNYATNIYDLVINIDKNNKLAWNGKGNCLYK